MSPRGLDAKANTLRESQLQNDVKLGLVHGLSFQKAKIHTLIISKNVLFNRSLSSMFPASLDLLDRASLPLRHHRELFSQCTPCMELFFYRIFHVQPFHQRSLLFELLWFPGPTN